MQKMAKRQKLSLQGDPDTVFNDLDLHRALTESCKKVTTVRTSEKKTTTGNLFYQKPSTTSLVRIRNKGSLQQTLSLKRCTSIQKTLKLIEIRQPSEEPQESLPVCSYFFENSMLHNNHDDLIQQMLLIPEEVKQMLHTNLFEVQNQGSQCRLDNKLTFSLYNTLNQLDKGVLQELFKENNPVLAFKMKYLIQSISQSSDMVVTMVRQACKYDQKLGDFLQNFWKFWVIIIDLAMQWMEKSSSDYVDFQVSQFKQQFQQALNDKNQMERLYLQSQKDIKNLEQSYCRKIDTLNRQILQLETEFNEYKVTIQQMSDLKQAEARMNNVGLKALEIENIFKQYDKQIQSTRVETFRDFKDIAQILVQRKHNMAFEYQENQRVLGVPRAIEDGSISLLYSIHPFVLEYERIEITENIPQLLTLFMDHIAMLEDIHVNVCRIMPIWLNDRNKQNQIITYLLDNDTPLTQFFCQLLGINNYQQVQNKCLRQIVTYYRQIQDENENIFQLESPLCLSDFISYFSLLFPEETVEKLNNLKSHNKVTLVQVLLVVLDQLITADQLTSHRTSILEEHDIVIYCITLQFRQFLLLKQQLNRTTNLSNQQMEELKREYRQLYILQPQINTKPQLTVRQKMQLAVKRVSQRQLTKNTNSPTKRQSMIAPQNKQKK
ncbi:hypothetical protein pb186bvf_008599 [Paramecium bursaria]